MAPTFAAYARSIITQTLYPHPRDLSILGPVKVHNVLTARDTTTVDRPDPDKGVLHPNDINNKAIFIVFGLVGVAFVCLGIWFFFWAKNGGFYFKPDDWDEYKSTVLRRKGPNGTTLSGATTITDLGGGSVYKDLHDAEDDDNQTEMTATTGITGITAGASDLAGREKHRRRREQKEREKERRREEKRREKDDKKAAKSRAAKVAKSPKRTVDADGAVIDDEAEAEAAEYLRNYRHERPARVGGLNRESDASTWDGSTNPTESSRGGTTTESTVTTELMPRRERSPEKKPKGGIRKVYSTADKRDSREAERIRAEARKLQEQGRAATAAASSSSGGGHRRTFSWQRDNTVHEGTAMMPPPTYSQSEVSTRIPGSWAESDVGSSDLGHRVYNHVIPGLSSAAAGSSVAGTDVRDYAEERTKNRRSGGGGYRRDRAR